MDTLPLYRIHIIARNCERRDRRRRIRVNCVVDAALFEGERSLGMGNLRAYTDKVIIGGGRVRGAVGKNHPLRFMIWYAAYSAGIAQWWRFRGGATSEK